MRNWCKYIYQSTCSVLVTSRKGFHISEAMETKWCPIYTLGGQNLRVTLKVSQEKNRENFCVVCLSFFYTPTVRMWGASNENGPNELGWANRRSTLADLISNERAQWTRRYPDASGGLLVPGLGSRGQAKLLVLPGPGCVWSWRGWSGGCSELPLLGGCWSDAALSDQAFQGMVERVGSWQQKQFHFQLLQGSKGF